MEWISGWFAEAAKREVVTLDVGDVEAIRRAHEDLLKLRTRASVMGRDEAPKLEQEVFTVIPESICPRCGFTQIFVTAMGCKCLRASCGFIFNKRSEQQLS